MKRHACHPDAGFTLMETIVAFVIFAAVVIALERGTALGWRGVRLAQMDQTALTLARTKLAAAGIESLVREDGDETGDEGGMTWRVSARKYTPPDGVALPGGIAAFWVTATVGWRDRPIGPARNVELTTLKRGSAP